jgi:hypothetical protein
MADVFFDVLTKIGYFADILACLAFYLFNFRVEIYLCFIFQYYTQYSIFDSLAKLRCESGASADGSIGRASSWTPANRSCCPGFARIPQPPSCPRQQLSSDPEHRAWP